jgi:hypothetical protein
MEGESPGLLCSSLTGAFIKGAAIEGLEALGQGEGALTPPLMTKQQHFQRLA